MNSAFNGQAAPTANQDSVLPRTAWELPASQQPGAATVQNPKHRSHFPAIVHWVATHRVADGWQIQRRFSNHFNSYRTRNRHLTELVSLGYLARLPFRALTPNHHIYAATTKGLRHVRDTFGEEFAIGLRSEEELAKERTWWHLRHELGLTEFALARELTIASRSDLELLMTLRRHDDAETRLCFRDRGELSTLEPDDQFVFRQPTTGQIVSCFVELDHGTATASRVGDKMRAYDQWAQSAAGHEYLQEVFATFGTDKRPNFRLLFVVRDVQSGQDNRRLSHLFAEALMLSSIMRDRIWLTTVSELLQFQYDESPLDHRLWYRVRHNRCQPNCSFDRKKDDIACRREVAAEQLAALSRVSLFPQPVC